MKPATNDPWFESAACTAHTTGDICPVVSPSDELVLPQHRRTVVQYLADENGAVELHLYYGDKDISFDEPDLFPFGETLARQAQFAAGDAADWGEGYEWPRIRDLLQQLIDAGILAHADAADRAMAPAGEGDRPSPLPPSTCPVARSWDECEAITQELTGRPVELGYLELIVPVFRIAHIALDADRRQVGEANVFPPALRLDVPTEWRTCHFPGTRYQSERPMNVTAMRVMRAHWPQMMAAALRVRETYLQRFPEARGAWTVGHVEYLSAAVLAVPTYQLMRQRNRVENGALHPALSSLFRVTDGVRMAMHQMMFIPFGEPSRSPHQAVTADDILDYAERNYSFHSGHGVCAGPKGMVRELIQVLLEGSGSANYASVTLEPAVQTACDDLDAAIDYGLHGLRAHAAVFSLWPAMTRAYARMAEMAEAWPSADTPAATAFRDSMQAYGKTLLKRTHLAHEEWRRDREDTYADMYRQCGRGVTGTAGALDLDALLAPAWTDVHRRTEAELQEIIQYRFECTDGFVLGLSSTIMDLLLREQATLRAAVAVQDEINSLLGREPPKRAISAADLNAYNLLQGANPGRLPFLNDELERLLGIRIELDANNLTITRQDAPA
jgi:hypothetical protein